MEVKRRETMRAEMAPDVYSGPDCDRHDPRWIGSAEGDMDGDGEVGIGGNVTLSAMVFPPGTTIVVSEPECPVCGSVPHLMSDWPEEQVWKCDCEFDWRAFTEELYS
ncbi:MAG: hypothetical protein KDK11_14715 [Maritimibacter sp.]|nr:hypothetical protein [Maritimibacter sp.]